MCLDVLPAAACQSISPLLCSFHFIPVCLPERWVDLVVCLMMSRFICFPPLLLSPRLFRPLPFGRPNSFYPLCLSAFSSLSFSIFPCPLAWSVTALCSFCRWGRFIPSLYCFSFCSSARVPPLLSPPLYNKIAPVSALLCFCSACCSPFSHSPIQHSSAYLCAPYFSDSLLSCCCCSRFLQSFFCFSQIRVHIFLFSYFLLLSDTFLFSLNLHLPLPLALLPLPFSFPVCLSSSCSKNSKIFMHLWLIRIWAGVSVMTSQAFMSSIGRTRSSSSPLHFLHLLIWLIE